ncbi:hypothetical protein D5086_011629 [Populus alba]|uniref:Uncharacterized protein n=1 Tax=Populus alba TaxID=43335 RepID=A0ACC4CEB7_POPAL
MESGIKQAKVAHDSINAKQDLSTEIPPENVPTRQNQPFETHAEQEERMIDSNNLENEAENGMHDLGVLSASRPAAASGSPVAPLRFEGTHGCGWRGSAATSAFRPASPRKTSDGDKTLETGGSSNSSKRRQVCLDIDLNVAGGERRSVTDLIFWSRKCQVSIQASIPGNLLWEVERLFDQGLYHSKTSQTASTYGGPKPGDPVISIMGTRVEVGSRMEVDRKGFIPQTTSMPNGKPLEHAMI